MLQALRFLKALVCLGVHFYMVQYFPVHALTTEWYYSLSILKRYPRSALYPLPSHVIYAEGRLSTEHALRCEY